MSLSVFPNILVLKPPPKHPLLLGTLVLSCTRAFATHRKLSPTHDILPCSRRRRRRQQKHTGRVGVREVFCVVSSSTSLIVSKNRAQNTNANAHTYAHVGRRRTTLRLVSYKGVCSFLVAAGSRLAS